MTTEELINKGLETLVLADKPETSDEVAANLVRGALRDLEKEFLKIEISELEKQNYRLDLVSPRPDYDPSSVKTLKGMLLVRQGRNIEASNILERVIDINSIRTFLHEVKIMVHGTHKKDDIGALEGIFDRSGNVRRMLSEGRPFLTAVYAGIAHNHLGNYDRAIEYLDTALQIFARSERDSNDSITQALLSLPLAQLGYAHYKREGDDAKWRLSDATHFCNRYIMDSERIRSLIFPNASFSVLTCHMWDLAAGLIASRVLKNTRPYEFERRFEESGLPYSKISHLIPADLAQPVVAKL